MLYFAKRLRNISLIISWRYNFERSDKVLYCSTIKTQGMISFIVERNFAVELDFSESCDMIIIVLQFGENVFLHAGTCTRYTMFPHDFSLSRFTFRNISSRFVTQSWFCPFHFPNSFTMCFMSHGMNLKEPQVLL